MDRDQLIALIQGANPALLEGVDTATATMEELQAILAKALAPAAAPALTESDENIGTPALTREETIAARA